MRWLRRVRVKQSALERPDALIKCYPGILFAPLTQSAFTQAMAMIIVLQISPYIPHQCVILCEDDYNRS